MQVFMIGIFLTGEIFLCVVQEVPLGYVNAHVTSWGYAYEGRPIVLLGLCYAHVYDRNVFVGAHFESRAYTEIADRTCYTHVYDGEIFSQ